MLEVGCGTGYVLSGLKKNKNIKLTGSEIYLDGLKFAKENNPGVEFFQVDICKVSFQNKYDIIGCFDVLEHIERDDAALKNIHASLKKDGLFLVSVPAYMFLWSFMDEINKHKRRYSKKEIISKVKAAGFSIQYCSSFVFALFPLILMNRIFNRKKNHKPVEQLTFDELSNYLNLDIHPVANGIFRLLMKTDELLMKSGIRLPLGSSIIIVAKK
jgi:SAM-dependent methyltransferase